MTCFYNFDLIFLCMCSYGLAVIVWMILTVFDSLFVCLSFLCVIVIEILLSLVTYHLPKYGMTWLDWETFYLLDVYCFYLLDVYCFFKYCLFLIFHHVKISLKISWLYCLHSPNLVYEPFFLCPFTSYLWLQSLISWMYDFLWLHFIQGLFTTRNF